MVGKTSLNSSRRVVAVERRLRLEPAGVDGLAAVGLRRGVGGRQRQVEARVEADRDHPRRDPARVGDQLGGRRARSRPPPRARARRRRGSRPRPRRRSGSTAPPGKHPDPRHEARLVVALSRADLEPAIGVLAAAAQQDHRGGGPRRRGCRRARAARRRPRDLAHAASLATLDGAEWWPRRAQQLWICTSCGFIYDPAEGDPDGGVPPGTAFDDIPDDWFCPVCGARKADFEPYEE